MDRMWAVWTFDAIQPIALAHVSNQTENTMAAQIKSSAFDTDLRDTPLRNLIAAGAAGWDSAVLAGISKG